TQLMSIVVVLHTGARMGIRMQRRRSRRGTLGRLLLALVAGSLILTSGLFGGPSARASVSPASWQQQNPSADPPSLTPYATASAVDDVATGQLVLYDPIVLLNCAGASPLWVWDGGTWSNPPRGPS